MNNNWSDYLGMAGAICIIIAYALLQSSHWRSEQVRYSLTNACGAAMILVSLAITPNLPSIVIEGFWLLISLGGVLRSLRKESKRHEP